MKTRSVTFTRAITILAAILVVIGLCAEADAMIFKSDTVTAQWDTWCYDHNGTYYLYYLVTEHTGEGFCVATSKDGVFWFSLKRTALW